MPIWLAYGRRTLAAIPASVSGFPVCRARRRVWKRPHTRICRHTPNRHGVLLRVRADAHVRGLRGGVGRALAALVAAATSPAAPAAAGSDDMSSMEGMAMGEFWD
jgi:hypothetical protein